VRRRELAKSKKKKLLAHMISVQSSKVAARKSDIIEM
jgi:hypothetical protein